MTDVLIRFRWLFLGILILVAGALTPGAMKAAVPDNALTVWFLETDPQLATYHEFQGEFGNDEVILMWIDTPETAFHPDVLKKIELISNQAVEVDGVAQVHSLLTIQDAWDTEDGLVFRPLIPTPIPDDPQALEDAKKRAQSNRLFANRVINEDATQTLVWIEMDVMGDIDARRDAIVMRVKEIGDEVLGTRKHAIGGLGVIYSGLNVLTQQDFGLFLGLGYLLMFVLLWWVFRSWRIVAATLGVISLATIIALGIYGSFGHRLNMVSVVIPTLIIILGVADAVHLPTAFVNATREHGGSRMERLRLALRRVALPATLTTITTMGGFLALATSPMATIQHLGIYSAIGIGVALFATFVLMSFTFLTLKDSYEPPEHRMIDRFLETAKTLVSTRKGIVAAALAVVIGLSAFGASQVVTDTYTIGYLPDDYWVVEQHETIEREWGNFTVLDFIVRPADGRTMRDPEVLSATQAFVEKASEHELLRNGLSVADIYLRMADVYSGEAEPTRTLNPEQVEQLSLFIEPKNYEWDTTKPAYDENFLAPFMTEDGKLGRVTLTGKMISAKTLDGLLDDIDAIGKDTMGSVATIEPAGYPPLYVVIIDYVMSSQIRGFFVALGVIFVMMLIGLRSFRLALISLPPNVFPVLVMMGVMGAFDLTLDVATATVAAIVVGISIDDTVHFLHHWREAENQGKTWKECLDFTFKRAGVAASITTILLAGGFPVLMLASLKTVFYFGLLTTVAAVAALLADLFLLPLLLGLWPPRSKDSGPHSPA